MNGKIKNFTDFQAVFNSGGHGYLKLVELKNEDPQKYARYLEMYEKEELRKNNLTDYILKYGMPKDNTPGED